MCDSVCVCVCGSMCERECGRNCSTHPGVCYRGTSLIRNSVDLGPYSRAMPRAWFTAAVPNARSRRVWWAESVRHTQVRVRKSVHLTWILAHALEP